jgi:HEAT repeat protein
MTTLLLLFATAFPTQPPQPATVAVEVAPAPTVVPDAKQIAAWVADIASADFTRQEAARAGLVKAGPKAKAAVPELITIAAGQKGRPDFASEVLGAIGPDAKDALPTLLAQCKPATFTGYLLDAPAIAVTRIDGPKLEITLALLQSSSKGSSIYLEASRYLREFPAQVVPHLVELCGSKDANLRIKAATVIGHLNGALANGHELHSLLERAGEGAKGVPAALEKLLADQNVQVRLTAAEAIASAAPQIAEKCIPVVIAAMKEKELSPKSNQYQAAAIFRPVPDQAAAALIPMFGGDDDGLRHWAIYVLAQLPVAKQVETALKDGKTTRTREAAALCFGAGSMSREVIVPPLTAALADREFAVRFAAALGIVTYTRRGDVPPAVVPVLVEGLKQAEADLRLSASKNLVEVGAPAKAAIPDLLRLLGDPQPGVPQEVALALVAISPTDAAPAVPTLRKALASGEDARFTVALAALGPVAKEALPELLKKFDSKHPGLRIAAAEAAARIDPTLTAKATDAIVPLLTDAKKISYDRGEAAMAMARIGPGAKAAVPTLLELLNDKGPSHVKIAIAAVAIDADAAKPARDWLRAQLTDNGEDKYEIAERLQELGKRAKPLLPELQIMLKMKVPYFREHAAKALGAIGPDANEALPILKELAAKDASQRVRTLATEAVKAIEGK